MIKRKLILAVDFDGTITDKNNWPTIKNIKKHAKEVINKLHDEYNVEIIIWTCRNNVYNDALNDAINFLKINDIHYDYINENSHDILKLWNAEFNVQDNEGPRKIFADFYIDDRNILMKNIDWIKILNEIILYKSNNKNFL